MYGLQVDTHPDAAMEAGIMTFEYLVQKNVGDVKLKTLAQKGGFATEDDALAEGQQEAERIALSAKVTLTVNARPESE